MKPNPSQNPIDIPETNGPIHRSFRLTNGPSGSALHLNDKFSAAVKSSLLQQIFALILSSCILDYGIIFRRFAIASAAYWIIAFVVLIRRRQEPTQLDIKLLKWGYWPLLVMTCALAYAWANQIN